MNVLATIGDPEGTRTVTSIIALLVAIGLALVMVAVWLHRTTRPDPELLAPLEAMGERKWRRSDPVAQRRRLDQYRPASARPITPSAAPPTLDEAFDAGPSAPGFDDLHADEAGDHDDADRAPDDLPGDRVPVDRVASTSASAMTAGPPLVGESTPKQIDRPGLDFGDEIDPDVLAAAAAELDAELHVNPDNT